MRVLRLLILPALLLSSGLVLAQNVEAPPMENRLAVLWTSGDPDVAHKVCLMYTHAAKKYEWFDEVVLIVWGPSARLLAGDKSLQEKIKAMQEDGIITEACVVCADSYGVSDQLRKLDVDVRGMGAPLSGYLKDGWKVLTF